MQAAFLHESMGGISLWNSRFLPTRAFYPGYSILQKIQPLIWKKLKMLDITRKNKNLIPTVESHRAVLVLQKLVLQIFFTGCGMRDLAIVKSGTTKDLSRQERSNMIK